ncbi:MAG: Uma2 family endonuclease [Pyrinomonadaceae bacterium]
MSRAPSLTHQRILGNVYALLKTYLDQNLIGEVLLTPGVIFDEFNSAIPDAVFLANQQIKNIGIGERILEAPELAIEIVSPGKENARRDREVKRQVYGKHGVKEYWIADPEMRTFEIYRLESSKLKLVAALMDEDEITTPVLPGFSCKVHQIVGR